MNLGQLSSQSSLRRADHSSRGVLPSVVSDCDREASTTRSAWPTGGCCAMEKIVAVAYFLQ